MKGKEICKALKEIRRQIAWENDIPYVVSQCTYQGECRGTCPKCESELRCLERELAIRQGLGKAVAVAGISVSVCSALTACSPADTIRDIWETGVVQTVKDAIRPEKEADLEGVATVLEGSDVDAPEQDFDYDLYEGKEESESENQAAFLEGEAMAPPETQQEQNMEIEGDIALPEEGTECGGESVPAFGEAAP